MFDVQYGDARTYARAYEIRVKGRTFVYVGNVDPLTRNRKGAIVRYLLRSIDHVGAAAMTDSECADFFSRLPFVRVDSLTVRQMTITAPDGSFRLALDYTHTMGSGEWPADTAIVTVH